MEQVSLRYMLYEIMNGVRTVLYKGIYYLYKARYTLFNLEDNIIRFF